jgi:hypothetical protein
MYGTPEYGSDDENPDMERDPLTGRLRPRQKEAPQIGEGGHVDSNPSPVVGGEGGTGKPQDDDVPFLMNPRRAMPAQPGAGGNIDFNPSPTYGEERNHQVWLLDDDPGIAKENDPRYRLVKPDPGTPNSPNQLLDYYIGNAIDSIANGDKVAASQMVGAAKTLIDMVKVRAVKAKNEVMLQKLKTYSETVAKIEQTINS